MESALEGMVRSAAGAMITIRRQHELGLAKARRVAESIAARLQKDYGGSYAWQGNDLQFGRTGVSGSVAVTKDHVQIHVQLGLLLRPLQGVIEREILEFCDAELGKEAPSEGVGGAPPDAKARRPRAQRRPAARRP
jgi:putative polyhydroxyalkanoate system protein